jgi:TRAP-type C4-dicarboxylate transport system permease small subunit
MMLSSRSWKSTVQKTPHNNTEGKSLIQLLITFSNRAEITMLCLLLVVMIGLACLQIILRTFFSGGLLWADPLLRYLVLWSGLLGAVLATSRGSHIALDLAGYIIPEWLRPFVSLAANLFSIVVAGMLTWASILFLQSELEYGSASLFNLPSWLWNSIFPLAFGLITARYLLLFIGSALTLLQSSPSPAGSDNS